MSNSASKSLSELLSKWQAGDSEALRALMPLVYADLRHLAHQCLRKERPAHTLQSTALVHEAYLRLTKREKVHFERRSDFFAVSAQLMRQILGCGVVFELSPQQGGTWTYTNLYSFQGGSDGIAPIGYMVIDSSGSLYGTTQLGGLVVTTGLRSS